LATVNAINDPTGINATAGFEENSGLFFLQILGFF
jgi:hypothetical protein